MINYFCCIYLSLLLLYITIINIFTFTTTAVMIMIALERCAGEVVTDILQIIETYEPDDAQMQLVMRGKNEDA